MGLQGEIRCLVADFGHVLAPNDQTRPTRISDRVWRLDRFLFDRFRSDRLRLAAELRHHLRAGGIDRVADLDMAVKLIVNSKCQRPGVCNACESLLVHREIASAFLPLAAAGGALLPLRRKRPS